MWSLVKEYTEDKNESSKIEIYENGIRLSDKETANRFNKYFLPVSPPEIISLISKLKNSNACGEDSISNNLLKKVACLIAEPFCHVINLSLEQGHFPTGLKKALVKPLFKKGDCKSVENYRPISLLSSISKIFENIVNKYLIDFLMKHKILDKAQHGFTKGRGLDSALADYLADVYCHVDKKITTLGLFIDFTKAFDCVHHSNLLQKLQRYGIRGKAYEWVASYLNNRTQKVIVNDTSSEATSIDIGVPQGSILGPTLFIIYVNDLPSYLRKKCNVMQMSYADDTHFVLTGADAEEKVKII